MADLKSEGMKVSIEKGELVIRVPLNAKPEPSSTGKTLVVASSRGNQPTEAYVDGERVIVGMNAYIKPGGKIVGTKKK